MAVDNFNKSYDTSTTGSTTVPNTYAASCGYRLPCGICTILNRQCPMQGNGYAGPVWRLPDITCQSDAPEAHYYESK